MRWEIVCQLVGDDESREWVVGWALRKEDAQRDLERAERKSPACYTYHLRRVEESGEQKGAS